MNAAGKPSQNKRIFILTIDFSASEYTEIIRHIESRMGRPGPEQVAEWARWALLEWVRSADED